MPSSWPAMLNLGAVVCLGGGVLIFPLWRRLLGKWVDKRQALLLSNTMVYLTPDESFSTNAQVPAANPIAGTENYSIGGKKKRTRTAQHSRKKRPVKQSEREVFGLHMVCPNSPNVFLLNRIIMPCLFWQFTLHVWVTRCLFQSFIISKLKYVYIVYIYTDVCREDHVYACKYSDQASMSASHAKKLQRNLFHSLSWDVCRGPNIGDIHQASGVSLPGFSDARQSWRCLYYDLNMLYIYSL